MLSDSDIQTRDASGDILQTIPFDTNNVTQLLQIFQQSITNDDENENLIFNDIVDEAKNFSIGSQEILNEMLQSEKYENLKLVIDKHGTIRVPNLFQVNQLYINHVSD